MSVAAFRVQIDCFVCCYVNIDDSVKSDNDLVSLSRKVVETSEATSFELASFADS